MAGSPRKLKPERYTIANFHQEFPDDDACLDWLWRHLHAEDPGERRGLLQLAQVLGRVDAEQSLERGRPRIGYEVGAQESRFREGAEDLLAPQRVQRDAQDALTVAGVIDERETVPPKPP